MNVEVPPTPEEMQEAEFQAAKERFEERVQQLVVDRGWPRRKAIKFLERLANRELKKLVKKGKKRQEQLRKEGQLVDTSDLKAELDAEFEKQLAEAGINPAELDKGSYVPPTSDF